jgi:hypothetical protein
MPFQAWSRLLICPSRTLISQRAMTRVHFCEHAVVRLCHTDKQSVCHAVPYDAVYDKIVRCERGKVGATIPTMPSWQLMYPDVLCSTVSC